MKKLMIALVAGAIGIAAQAANVTWSINSVSASGTDTTPEGYVAYFLLAADTSGAASAKVWSIADAKTAAASKDADAFSSHAISASKTLDDEGNARSAKVTTYAASWVSPESANVYAVIFNADSIADATEYMVVGGAEADGSLKLTFGTATANQTASLNASSATWTAASVPEPTSGLLMLLGVAGLALRRRRA